MAIAPSSTVQVVLSKGASLTPIGGLSSLRADNLESIDENPGIVITVFSVPYKVHF